MSNNHYIETRKVRIEDAGRYWGDGKHSARTYDAVIEITIDLNGIANTLGRRAVLSKGKKSIDGHVTVRAHSVTEVQS